MNTFKIFLLTSPVLIPFLLIGLPCIIPLFCPGKNVIGKFHFPTVCWIRGIECYMCPNTLIAVFMLAGYLFLFTGTCLLTKKSAPPAKPVETLKIQDDSTSQ